jgi:hypothetical protein
VRALSVFCERARYGVVFCGRTHRFFNGRANVMAIAAVKAHVDEFDGRAMWHVAVSQRRHHRAVQTAAKE